MRFGIKAMPLAASLATVVLVAGAVPAFASYGAFAYDEATGNTAPAGIRRPKRRPTRPPSRVAHPTNARSFSAPPAASAARSRRPRTGRPGAARSGLSATRPKKRRSTIVKSVSKPARSAR